MRAERLGATMLLFGIVREPATDALEREPPLLTEDELEAWRATDDEDVRLAHACLNAEFELRDRQWQALEFLLYARSAPEACLSPPPPGRAELPSGGSEPEPQDLVVLPRAHVVAVAELALGW